MQCDFIKTCTALSVVGMLRSGKLRETLAPPATVRSICWPPIAAAEHAC